jgi:hypothetical protein
MQEIPDTGGGLAGFIAWLLWHVYVYFPFEGTWDWLVLIVFLAVLTRGIMIPVWWRLVMRPGQLPSSRDLILNFVLAADLIWPWLVIWLFNTAGGRTFLEGRSRQAPDVAEVLYWCFTHGIMALGASLLYWHWSVASLVVFLAFGVTSVTTAVIVALLAYLGDLRRH